MKRILSITFVLMLVFLTLSVTVTTAFAEDYAVTLGATCTYDENEDVYNIHVTIGNIKDEEGVAFFDVFTVIDTNVFEYVGEPKYSLPDLWKDYIGKGEDALVEDLSHFEEKIPGSFEWCMLAFDESLCIKDDGQLFLDIKIKAKKQQKSQIIIYFEGVSCFNDIDNDLTHNDLSITVDTTKPSDVSVDLDVSVVVSEEESNPFSNPGESSGGTTVSIRPPYTSTEIEEFISGNANEDYLSGENSISGEQGNNEKSNTILIVCLAVGGLAVVAAVVIVIVNSSKKSKKG